MGHYHFINIQSSHQESGCRKSKDNATRSPTTPLSWCKSMKRHHYQYYPRSYTWNLRSRLEFLTNQDQGFWSNYTMWPLLATHDIGLDLANQINRIKKYMYVNKTNMAGSGGSSTIGIFSFIYSFNGNDLKQLLKQICH